MARAASCGPGHVVEAVEGEHEIEVRLLRKVVGRRLVDLHVLQPVQADARGRGTRGATDRSRRTATSGTPWPAPPARRRPRIRRRRRGRRTRACRPRRRASAAASAPARPAPTARATEPWSAHRPDRRRRTGARRRCGTRWPCPPPPAAKRRAERPGREPLAAVLVGQHRGRGVGQLEGLGVGVGDEEVGGRVGAQPFADEPLRQPRPLGQLDRGERAGALHRPVEPELVAEVDEQRHLLAQLEVPHLERDGDDVVQRGSGHPAER